VVFTDPPFVAGGAALCATWLVGGDVIADCHSGAFNDPRWERFATLHRQVLRRCSGLIFHTDEMHEVVMASLEPNPPWAVVVSLFSMVDKNAQRGGASAGRVRATIVVPASHSFDEPIQAILKGAALCPEVEFVITGKAPGSASACAPPNVHFTGWLSEVRYCEEIAACTAMLCLTTRQSTMQNGLVEGLEYSKPVIVSATDTLLRWANDVPGVLPVADHEPATIARAVTTIVERAAEWSDRAAEGFVAASHRFDLELDQLRRHMMPSRGESSTR
jgi:glycosyltransferase involved in cell wall biosynthesis